MVALPLLLTPRRVWLRLGLSKKVSRTQSKAKQSSAMELPEGNPKELAYDGLRS